MATSDSLDLSLLENSHAFIAEAVSKALHAQADPRQWQFAVLHLVQAAELSLKAALRSIHPVLIFASIDSPRITVTLDGAIQRLESPAIGGLSFSTRDKKRLKQAASLRNRLIHSDFTLTPEYAAANFFELFSFVSDFHRRHLSSDLSEVIPENEFSELVQIKQAVAQLVRRAKARMLEENVDQGLVWACPNCGEDTFVTEDAIDRCYACSYVEPVIECPQCGRECFEHELESFFDEIDSDYSEGRVEIHNSYGYVDFRACPDCLPGVRESIQNQRAEEEFHRMEEAYLLKAR